MNRICRTLSDRPSLSMICLKGRRFGADLLPQLAQALLTSRHLGTVTTLDFRGNRSGDAAAVAVALVMENPKAKSLRTVDVRGCEIRDYGAVAIAKALCVVCVSKKLFYFY